MGWGLMLMQQEDADFTAPWFGRRGGSQPRGGRQAPQVRRPLLCTS